MGTGKLRGEQIKDESIESVDIASGSIKAGEMNEQAIRGQALITSTNVKDDRLLVWDATDTSLKEIAPRNLFGEVESTDIHIFVSGAIGSKGHSDTGGTSDFGGDVAISGSLFVGCDDNLVPESRALDVYANVSSDYAAVIDNDASSAGHGLKVTSDGTGSGTYLLDIESASTTLFRVRGDGRVGIGKVASLPAAILTVSSSNTDGDIAVAHKIQHIGDADTFIEFGEDEINIEVGDRQMIKMTEAGTDKIIINNALVNVDFQIKGANHANLFRTDAQNDRVGIGTNSPNSTFEIEGSQAGAYESFTSATKAIDETHFIVDYQGTGATASTVTLPSPASIAGRLYHILNNSAGGGTVTVSTPSGVFLGAHLENDSSTSIELTGDGSSRQMQGISIASTGDNWFILHDGRSE